MVSGVSIYFPGCERPAPEDTTDFGIWLKTDDEVQFIRGGKDRQKAEDVVAQGIQAGLNQDSITVSLHTRYGKLKTTEKDRFIIKKLIQTATHAYTSLKLVKKDSIDYGSGPGSAHRV